MSRLHHIFAVLATAVLAACSMSQDTSVAEQEVPKFHQQLDAGNFESLYDSADEKLQKASPKAEFLQFLTAVHRKLGNVKTSTKSAWNVNYNTSGTFVTLNFDTEFERGKSQENFVYRLSNGQVKLVGYHINSTALIVN